jgi:large subunit ribosomal protein L22
MEAKGVVEARAIARYVRVTPRKADQVLQLIRGKRADQAAEILAFTPKHIARTIQKVLHSAVANAVAMEGKINVETLHIKQATAGAGPTMKRILPRAQGRATPILKRTSHITIVVEGEASADTPAPSRRARAPKAEAPAKAKAAAATASAKPSEKPKPKTRSRKAAAATKES